MDSTYNPVVSSNIYQPYTPVRVFQKESVGYVIQSQGNDENSMFFILYEDGQTPTWEKLQNIHPHKPFWNTFLLKNTVETLADAKPVRSRFNDTKSYDMYPKGTRVHVIGMNKSGVVIDSSNENWDSTFLVQFDDFSVTRQHVWNIYAGASRGNLIVSRIQTQYKYEPDEESPLPMKRFHR